jgi:soluble lytic murein transglycosylase-like protein
MQLLPRFHSHPLLDIDDPETNLSIGCAYLRRLIDGRGGNVRLALRDYVAGPNRKETTNETRDYANDIIYGSAQ